jgi:hypothetical protein
MRRIRFFNLLGALTNLQEVTVNFVIYVHPSVCPSIRMEQWTGFHEIWYLSIFKYVLKIQVSLKSEKNSGTLREDQDTFLIISRLLRLRMRNISDKRCRQNQHTHILCSITFFENRAVWHIVEIYCRAGQTTDDNMAHTHCMLDN